VVRDSDFDKKKKTTGSLKRDLIPKEKMGEKVVVTGQIST